MEPCPLCVRVLPPRLSLSRYSCSVCVLCSLSLVACMCSLLQTRREREGPWEWDMRLSMGMRPSMAAMLPLSISAKLNEEQ